MKKVKPNPMAGCSGQSRKGSISPETLRRRTENIQSLLETTEGREDFCKYLDERELEDAVNHLTFWELCNELAPEEQNTSSFLALANEADNLQEKAQEILKFATEHVKLDFGYQQRLHRAIADGNQDEILKTVRDMKQAAVRDLETTHHLYSEHLLQERGM